jgi:predicted nucleic acid-binding protein
MASRTAVRPQVPDTTVFVELVRQPHRIPAFLRSVERGQVYLSAVVAAELFTGSRSSEEAELIEEIVRAFAEIERLITPSTHDWLTAARLLNRRNRLNGDIRPRDHLADVLIVISAARLRGEITSANLRHFSAWIRLAQRAGLDVTLSAE